MLDLLAPVVELFFRFVSQAVQFVLALQHDFLLLGLCGFNSIRHDAFSLLLGRTDLTFSLVLR